MVESPAVDGGGSDNVGGGDGEWEGDGRFAMGVR